MLSERLIKFCNDNFKDRKFILEKLNEFKKILISENEKMNLIGKSTLEDFDERHFLDCIQINKYLPDKNKTVMDIGTGAGLPGVILSIIGFQKLHLVEKSPKKSAFLENCKLRLNLNYHVHNKSITDLSNMSIDCITARAFAPIEKIISTTKKLINKKTIFILLKGKTYLTELETINTQKYFWDAYSSITSDQSKIIVMGIK